MRSHTGRRRCGRAAKALLVIVLAIGAAAPAGAATVTGAADNLRTAWYPDEPTLTAGTVSGSHFGEAFVDKLKGQVYAQPLVANGTLLVVTEENWAYGIDPVTGAVRWKEQFGTPVEAGTGRTIDCTDLEPHVGITGTPVIDTETNTAYFVSNRYLSGGAGAIGWFMHAVNLADGAEAPGFPVQIKGEARNLHGVEFEPVQEMQRPALLLMDGVVYAGFGSHCDHEPYEGWIAGVSTASGQLTTLWATSGHGASIWQAGGGLISDGPGQIMFSTGNGFTSEPGLWDPPEGSSGKEHNAEGHLAMSVVRAEVQPGGELQANDFFSPFNDKHLDEGDLDLGSSAPIALPSPYFGTASTPHLLVQSGKQGVVYLLNRDALGGRGKGSDHVVFETTPLGGQWDGSAVWPGDGGYVYVPAVSPPENTTEAGDHLRFFKYQVNGSGNPALSLAATTPGEVFAFGSGSPIVTSSGTTPGSALLWTTWCPGRSCENARLRAYSAVPSGPEPLPLKELPIKRASKFSRPLASGGHVYVGNREGELLAFSSPQLTPSAGSLELAAPVGETVTREITLTSSGTKLRVAKVSAPGAPFQITGLPAEGTELNPGQAITVSVTFKPAARGASSSSFEIEAQGGFTLTVPLSGSGEENAQERAEREARERAEREATERAEREAGERVQREARERAEAAAQAARTTLVTPPGPPFALVEPAPALTSLQIRVARARSSTHRHRVAVAFRLSAAGVVELAVYRRVAGHCGRERRSCFRYLPATIRLTAAERSGADEVVLDLGTRPAGVYRLVATPFAAKGARGAARYIEFHVS